MALETADQGTRTALAAAGLLLLGGGAVLAGCVQQRAPAPPGRAAAVQSDSSFFFNNDPEMATFGYGVRNSDVLDMMMSCAPGSRQIQITDELSSKAPTGGRLSIGSGATSSELPATVEDEIENGGKLAVVKTAIDLPALTAFRKSGALKLSYAGAEQSFAASASERAMAARFFAICERK